MGVAQPNVLPPFPFIIAFNRARSEGIQHVYLSSELLYRGRLAVCYHMAMLRVKNFNGNDVMILALQVSKKCVVLIRASYK